MNNFNRIELHNWGGTEWELKTITFDEWSKRFAYSAILAHHFYLFCDNHRAQLIDDFGTDTFQIKHPDKEGNVNLQYVVYQKELDRFSFKR